MGEERLKQAEKPDKMDMFGEIKTHKFELSHMLGSPDRSSRPLLVRNL